MELIIYILNMRNKQTVDLFPEFEGYDVPKLKVITATSIFWLVFEW